jgi:phosphate transport system permease protein
MSGYLLRRLLALVPTLFIASIIVFGVVRLVPGNVLDLMLSENDFSSSGHETRDQLEEALGLDEPIYVQYLVWVRDIVFYGDLGDSLWRNTPVLGEIAARLPVTLELGLLSMLVALLIAVPIGVGAAIYLEEYAPDNRFTRFLEVNIRNLAGVPSIIYGILGLYVFVRVFEFGPTILPAGLTLSLLILPVIIITGQEALRSVPDSLRQGAYGIGATKWQTVSRIVVPNAVSGIFTGVILSLARAIGETAPLLLIGAAAFVPFLPEGVFSTYTVIPVQIYSWVS